MFLLLLHYFLLSKHREKKLNKDKNKKSMKRKDS
jgi:hypothetical protein